MGGVISKRIGLFQARSLSFRDFIMQITSPSFGEDGESSSEIILLIVLTKKLLTTFLEEVVAVIRLGIKPRFGD